MSYPISNKEIFGVKFDIFRIIWKDCKLLKTLYYNLKYPNISWQLRIYPRVYIKISPSANIVYKGGLVRLGLRWNVERFRPTEFLLRDNAILEIHDNFDIYTGCNIVVDPGAKLSFGKGALNHNVRIVAFKSITIGYNVYIGENSMRWDSDNHQIAGNSSTISAPITIGNNVLVGMNATILKGVTIGDGAVVAANSLVLKSVPPRALVGGVPAKVLKENIKWSL